jgi:hypothetical protein
MLWCLYINLFHWKELWVIHLWNWKHQHITLWIQQNNGFMKKSLEEILSFATRKSMIKCFKQSVIDYNNMILFQILRVKNCSHIVMMHLTIRWWHGNMEDDVFFHYKFSSILHSQLMTKWCGCSKYHMKMWLG